MKISELGEFKLIHRISKKLNQIIPKQLLGIGDDCALIPISKTKSLIVTTDLLVEDIHFLKNSISAKELGHKALAVNLSDIAAMGAKPKHAFLSIALPKNTDVVWVDRFISGLKKLAHLHHVLILGGDTTKSPHSIIISITLIGEMRTKNAKLRSQAKVGDIICVTGKLGDSAGGLQLVLKNKKKLSRDLSTLLKKHHQPRAHLKEGQWLAKQNSVHAMMDVSDGIDSDLRQILESSHCGGRIELEKVPLSKNLKTAARKFNWNALEMAATGGEDYCLLLTVEGKSFSDIASRFKIRFGAPLYPIGKITEKKNILEYTLHGKKHCFFKSGFDHFKGK